jgi:hypothetical protein
MKGKLTKLNPAGMRLRLSMAVKERAEVGALWTVGWVAKAALTRHFHAPSGKAWAEGKVSVATSFGP